ncbi:MAG: ABC transporter substrate-binding protein [Candidatus Omnitrophota bacterium]|nr:ABC transporter substrate-binding protein [Candidatus Omnitrophota bacterium]
MSSLIRSVNKKIPGLLIFLFLFFNSSAYAAKVAIVNFADNPDYQNCRIVFSSLLKKEAANRNVPMEIVYIDTKGNMESFIKEAKAIENSVDLFFTVGRPSALALKEAGITKPVLFNAIANPVGVVVNSLVNPGTNFTGVHSAVPVNKQLKALQMVIMRVKKIGLLYSQDNPFSLAQIKKWKEAINELVDNQISDLEIAEFPIPASVDTEAALVEMFKREVAGNADVLVAPDDSKITNLAAGLIAAVLENNMPFYSSDTAMVRKGALLSLGFDYAEGAKLSVPIAFDIINGRSPAGISVATYPQYKMYLNLKTAQKIKLSVTMEAIKNASEIFKE